MLTTTYITENIFLNILVTASKKCVDRSCSKKE